MDRPHRTIKRPSYLSACTWHLALKRTTSKELLTNENFVSDSGARISYNTRSCANSRRSTHRRHGSRWSRDRWRSQWRWNPGDDRNHQRNRRDDGAAGHDRNPQHRHGRRYQHGPRNHEYADRGANDHAPGRPAGRYYHAERNHIDRYFHHHGTVFSDHDNALLGFTDRHYQ